MPLQIVERREQQLAGLSATRMNGANARDVCLMTFTATRGVIRQDGSWLRPSCESMGSGLAFAGAFASSGKSFAVT
jgi:hypothetical protein